MAEKQAGTETGLTLGSASPRRAALLGACGIDFDVEVVEIDEHAQIDPHEKNPRVVVETIAAAKFAAFPANRTNSLLLTADTLVACNGSIMGKPGTSRELTAMLESMSGCELRIATAVCVGSRGATPQRDTITTVVELRALAAEEIHDYVATGAGMDKAGGLALQSQAKSFIHRVHGCWSNVLGLPVCATTRLLAVEGAQTDCSVALCGSHAS